MTQPGQLGSQFIENAVAVEQGFAEAVTKAGQYAYRDRKVRKREFRALWIQRIGAAAKINGLSYSRFVHGLKEAGVELDRKVLADIAVHDSVAFGQLAEQAKASL